MFLFVNQLETSEDFSHRFEELPATPQGEKGQQLDIASSSFKHSESYQSKHTRQKVRAAARKRHKRKRDKRDQGL